MLDFPRRLPAWREIGAQILQLGLAALGGYVFALIGVPAGWLSGAVAVSAVFVVSGRSRPLPPLLADLAMLLAGVSMGAGATPEAIAAMSRYPASLALLALAMLAVTFACAAYLRTRPGWTWEEAILASVPGALAAVLAVAVDRRARLSPIVVVQLFRLLALVLVLPSAINAVSGTPPLGANAAGSMGLGELALILLGGAVVSIGYRKLRFAAAMMLGALTVSAAVHAGGLVTGGLPPFALATALVLIGCFIGSRMRGVNRQSLQAVLPDAAVSFLIGLAVAGAFAGLTVMVAGIGFEAAFVAFAPGGLEAMVVLALVMGLDPLYVGTHHLARAIGINFILPIAMRTRRGVDDE